MDDKKFLEYINKYKDELYSFLKHNLKNKSTIDDVFSEAILTAYQNKDKFVEGTNFKAWIYKILLNKCFIANRDISLYWEPIDDYTDKLSYDPRNKYNGTEKHKLEHEFEKFLENCSGEVFDAFSQLSGIQKMCIYLKDVEGFSYKEIAEILSIPQPSVMTHLSRGRSKLRKVLFAKYQKIHEESNHNTKNQSEMATTQT